MIVRALLASFLLAVPALAQEPSLDEQIAAAEAPLVEFRENYRKALERERDKAQAEGKLEQLKLIERDLKVFNEGAWPDGTSVFAQRDATFIVNYWRLRPKTDKALREVAARAKSGPVNDRIQARIDHWTKEPIDAFKKGGDKLLVFKWKLGRDPIAAGVFGSPEPGKGKSITDYLKQQVGVKFPEGSTASLLDGPNLVVKLPASELLIIDQWLRSKNLL